MWLRAASMSFLPSHLGAVPYFEDYASLKQLSTACVWSDVCLTCCASFSLHLPGRAGIPFPAGRWLSLLSCTLLCGILWGKWEKGGGPFQHPPPCTDTLSHPTHQHGAEEPWCDSLSDGIRDTADGCGTAVVVNGEMGPTWMCFHGNVVLFMVNKKKI